MSLEFYGVWFRCWCLELGDGYQVRGDWWLVSGGRVGWGDVDRFWCVSAGGRLGGGGVQVRVVPGVKRRNADDKK